MTVYILGAGASKHAGYPLAREMGAELFTWMKRQTRPDPNYPAIAESLEAMFGRIDDLEALISRLGECIREREGGTWEQRARGTNAKYWLGRLKQSLPLWFSEIRNSRIANSYACFANHVVESGDCIVTFNYDASLERELKRAGKWEIGDGYGFDVDGFSRGSLVKVLKLHGSAGWLALASGLPEGGSSKSVSRVFADDRPAISGDELKFLRYPDPDPIFHGSPGPEVAIIMPAGVKEFYFDAGLGPEWDGFWGSLWQQAAGVLQRATRVVICGYGMLPIDEKACELLLDSPNKSAEIIVSCGGRSDEIVSKFRDNRFERAVVADYLRFEDWVARFKSYV